MPRHPDFECCEWSRCRNEAEMTYEGVMTNHKKMLLCMRHYEKLCDKHERELEKARDQERRANTQAEDREEL